MKADDRVVLIAGGHGALGQAVVPAFEQIGVRVFTVDDHRVQDIGKRRTAIQGDLTDEREVQRVVSEVTGESGRIDVLVNLVGTFAPGRVVDTDATVWQRMLTVNVTSAFLLSKAVLPLMLGEKSGRIVHIAAQAALNPFAGASAYIVSKSALIALIRTLALETAGHGVTVNGILPTTIDTPANRKNMPDADRSTWVSSSAIADMIVFLASSNAASINGALIPMGSQ